MADWFSTFGDGSYQTSTGNIGFGNIIYYDRKFLKRATEAVVLYQFGQRRPLPKGNGKQIRFFRYNEIPLSSTYNLLTEGVNPDATAIKGQEINATLKEYGAFSQHSSLVTDTHIDRNLEGVVGLWGDQAGRTVDMLTWAEVALYGNMPLRVDEMTSNQGVSYQCFNVPAENTASQTSVSVYAFQTDGTYTLGATADWWNGGLLCVTEGTNEGQTRYVYDYASTATTHALITVSPGFETACDSSSKFRIVSSGGLTAGDIPTYDTLREVKARLTHNLATPYGGGYYVCVADADVIADLQSDTQWKSVTAYNPDGGFYQGELGKIGGFRFVETTQCWRHTAGTAQTRVAGGRVYTTLFLGQEAFGVTAFPGMNRPKIIIKNPGSQDTSNPLNRYSTVGWVFPFVPKALNSKFAIGLWSYH